MLTLIKKTFPAAAKNPLKYYEETLYSFNTPDFTQEKVSFDTEAAQKAILSDTRIMTKVK